jgi:ketosteroid isomerase-like protein
LPQNDSEEIKLTIEKYFNIGKSKDLEAIQQFLIEGFHKFGDTAPYERRDRERALMLEQLQFASVSDFDFKIQDLRIEVFGTMALATFVFESTGMVVDDYSFRGATVKSKLRVTVVLKKEEKEANKWKMIHQHLSKFQG